VIGFRLELACDIIVDTETVQQLESQPPPPIPLTPELARQPSDDQRDAKFSDSEKLIEDLKGNVDSLNAKLEERSQALQQLQGKVDLQSKLDATAQTQIDDYNTQINGLNARIAQLQAQEQRITTAAGAPTPQPAPSPDLTAMQQQTASLQSANQDMLIKLKQLGDQLTSAGQIAHAKDQQIAGSSLHAAYLALRAMCNDYGKVGKGNEDANAAVFQADLERCWRIYWEEINVMSLGDRQAIASIAASDIAEASATVNQTKFYRWVLQDLDAYGRARGVPFDIEQHIDEVSKTLTPAPAH
jgi:uncharacterized phage infection (PIP) family protein YhgE